MSASFLLELGLEEMPARFVPGAIRQLQEKTETQLTDARIRYTRVRTYATPRRLAVLVEGMADKQDDVQEEVRGPALKAARADDGSWTKAALGFARSQGVATDELQVRDYKGTPYVFAVKSETGKPTRTVLEQNLAAWITTLSFPKNMRWASWDLRYVRPLRWIVALYDREIIPVEVAGVKAGNRTRGHRFLGSETNITSADQYVETLAQQFVIADVSARRDQIVQQIETLSADRGWHIAVRDDLLEEIVHLVEYPTVLCGDFDPEFLQIPQEVLITTMREHQRYFPVMDAAGKLLPHFVTVRNGDDRSLGNVAKGNEKVLSARLADARFFYREDLRLAPDEAVQKLDAVVFHEELGSIGDKSRRIRHISAQLAKHIQLDAQSVTQTERAATLCKFDLVTQMVNEFPELEGVMGQDYALAAGEEEAVARAIFEHYQPRYAGDALPSSMIGALVGIADKIDTLVGCFSLGIVPTGSQDPYALRRQAAGIVHILQEKQMPIGLKRLIGIALDVLEEERSGLKRNRKEIEADLLHFFSLRVKKMLDEVSTYDRIEAVMSVGFDDVASTWRRAQALHQYAADAQHAQGLESFIRVGNLADKAESSQVDPQLFVEEAERKLHATWIAVHADYERLLANQQEADALVALAGLKEAINRFFDEVMVMSENKSQRVNRLALLASINADLQKFADFKKLVRE